jgi:ribulose-phosphate 3-epimerase
LHRTIIKIKQLGCKAGVVINPATPVSSIEDILDEVDLVLLMSVNPGFGGQSFLRSTLKKIQAVADIKVKYNLNYLIEVDGGIGKSTIVDVCNAGCEVFVAGSSVFHSNNITAAVTELKNLINN